MMNTVDNVMTTLKTAKRIGCSVDEFTENLKRLGFNGFFIQPLNNPGEEIIIKKGSSIGWSTSLNKESIIAIIKQQPFF